MKELPDIEYLRDLAQRLWHIPVKYGTDQDDIDRLNRLAKKLEKKPQRVQTRNGVPFKKQKKGVTSW